MDRRCVKGMLLIGFMSCAAVVDAQVYSDKVVGQKNAALADSLKHSVYPYALPIWGDKATKRGFNLPYSAGLSLQYYGQRSDLILDNVQVGFNSGPMYNLDGLIRFDKAKSSSDGISRAQRSSALGAGRLLRQTGYGRALAGKRVWLQDSRRATRR